MERNTFKINYGVAFFIGLFHVGLIAALFNFTMPLFALAVLVWCAAGSPGIGVGFHRLLTHRGFATCPWVEYTLTLLGCMALQGGPITWVAVHRKHHQFTEQVGLDPHTTKEGFFWAHIWWMIASDPELRTPQTLMRYALDLHRNRFHRRMNRVWWLPMTLFALTLLGVGGFTVMLWGVAVPIVIGWHSTWLVNSATHRWGSKRFATPDNSRNNWWVALLTFGEGWHNTHHKFPGSARHGLVWYELDLNWYLIRFLKVLGLAWNVKEIESVFCKAALKRATG